MTPLFLVITENKAFAQLCRKALTNAGFQSSKLASACLSNGRKSVTALSPDYVLLDGDCQNNMDDYIISLAPRYSVPIIYLTIQHNNKYPMMQAGAIDVVYKPDGTPSDNERFQKRFAESMQLALKYGLQPKRLQWVHSKIDKPAWIFLMEMQKGGSYGLDVLPPLIMYNQDGSYTEQVKKFYEPAVK